MKERTEELLCDIKEMLWHIALMVLGVGLAAFGSGQWSGVCRGVGLLVCVVALVRVKLIYDRNRAEPPEDSAEKTDTDKEEA